MLLSAIIPLTAQAAAPPPAFTGRQAMAAILSAIGQRDAALSARLHADSEGRKPLTVSPLLRWNGRAVWRTPITQGERYALRVTSLDSELSCQLLQDILPSLPPTMRLGALNLQVGSVCAEPAQHPLARQSSVEALYDEWFSSATTISHRIALEFFSPTAIKRQGRYLVVPWPPAIFHGYLRAWNQFARPALADDLIDIIERDVVISQYDLRTETLSLREAHGEMESSGERQPYIGFVGHCAFTVFRPERALWRTLHLLADFAFYCGTGYKTTQGMGQTRKVENPKPPIPNPKD